MIWNKKIFKELETEYKRKEKNTVVLIKVSCRAVGEQIAHFKMEKAPT